MRDRGDGEEGAAIRTFRGKLLLLALLAFLWSPPAAVAQPLQPLGPNFKISAQAGDMQGKPAIASDGINFFVVWRDRRNFATNGYDIYGARVTPDGTVLDPDGIPISTVPNADPNPGNQYIPSVAFDGTNYLVVWTELRDASPSYELYAARVTPAGTVLDPDGRQITSGAYALRMPSVAFDGTNYLVVWRGIRGMRVSTGGVGLDGPTGFQIGSGFYPWVAFDGTNYLVVWHGWGAAGTLDIFGARVSKAGQVLDPGGFVVSSASEDQDHSSVAFGGTNYLVVWNDQRGGDDFYNGSVYGARVSTGGTVLDPIAFKVADYARGQVAVNVAFDGTEYLVVWQVDNTMAKFRLVDVYGRRVSKDGVVLDQKGIPIATSYGHQGWAPVVGFGMGRYLVAWSEGLSGGRCYNGCVYGQLLQRQAGPEAALHPRDTERQDPSASSAERALDGPGQAWVMEASPTAVALYSIWGVDDTNAYAVGEDGVILRYNGSQWTLATQLPRGRQYAVWGSAPDDVWSVGWCWDIFHFDGLAWASTNCQDYPPGTYPIGMGMWGSSRTNILTVGVQGAFIEYDGVNWRKKPTGVSVDLWDVWGTSSRNAYAVGERGTILRYDGSTWAGEANVPTLQSLNAIWGNSPNDIFAVGDFGTILRWDGTTWTSQGSGTNEHLFGVWGCGPSEVYAVGLNGTILRFDGSVWSPEASGTTQSLLDVWGGGNAIRAVGDNGTILRKAASCPYQTMQTLTVSKAGTGSGTVVSNPAGIDCGADCSEAYLQGTTVTLTATAAAGSVFAGWIGACMQAGVACTVSMDASKAVTATFNQATLALTLGANGATFRPGESLIVSVGVDNPGLAAMTVDFYFGALLPDGDTIVFFRDLAFSAGTGRLSAPETLQPIVTGVDLAAPFVFSNPSFFTHTWTGGEPPGTYVLFLAAVRPGALADNAIDAGDLVVLATAAVTFAP